MGFGRRLCRRKTQASRDKSVTNVEWYSRLGGEDKPSIGVWDQVPFVFHDSLSLGPGPVLERDFVHSPPFVKMMFMHLWFTMK